MEVLCAVHSQDFPSGIGGRGDRLGPPPFLPSVASAILASENPIKNENIGDK
jgi:hypothetical protein